MTKEKEELKIDKSNAVHLLDVDLYIEAVDNKILVLSDPYKSGYECKTCGGTGKVKSLINEDILRDCDDCKGKGHTIFIPDNAKTTPTSGTIVSIGAGCKIRTRDDIGKRVLIGPYTGTGIPVKNSEGIKSIRIRSIREDEIICWLWGANTNAKDFIDFTPDINEAP